MHPPQATDSPPATGSIRLDGEPPVLRLTLDHPAVANALNDRMMGELAAHLDSLEAACADPAWDGVGLVLRGAGLRAFCAGSDLRLVREKLEDPAAAEAMSRRMQGLTERLRRLPLVSVAAIEGAAVGGGAELATATDLRVMARDAVLRFVHPRVGLSPGWGGGVRLERIVGRRAALPLLARAEAVEAAQALALGLCDRVCEPGDAEATARELLQAYTRHHPAAQRGAKAVIGRAGAISDEAYAAERAIFVGLWGGPAHRAAMAR